MIIKLILKRIFNPFPQFISYCLMITGNNETHNFLPQIIRNDRTRARAKTSLCYSVERQSSLWIQHCSDCNVYCAGISFNFCQNFGEGWRFFAISHLPVIFRKANSKSAPGLLFPSTISLRFDWYETSINISFQRFPMYKIV